MRTRTNMSDCGIKSISLDVPNTHLYTCHLQARPYNLSLYT